MLTQAVTELSATLAASPDIETSWNRIVQQGTPIIESIDTQTVRVTFLWRQPEETEVERVYLDANSLTDHHAEQLSVMQRLGDSPVWFYTAEVSNTWRSSYSIIPVPKSVVDEFDYPGAGKEDSTRRTRWLGLLEHRIATHSIRFPQVWTQGVPSPRCPWRRSSSVGMLQFSGSRYSSPGLVRLWTSSGRCGSTRPWTTD